MISPGDSPQVKVAKGAAIIFAGLVFARVVNYAYQILITRFAGADEYGLFFQGVTTLAVAAGMAVLGYDLGVARFAPFYMGSRDENRLHGVIRGAFLLSLANGVAAGIILWLLAGWLSGLYFGGEALRGQTIIRICAAVMPFAVSRMVLIKAIVAFQKIGYRVAVNQFASPVVRLALTALLLAAGMAAEGAMLAYAASELVSWAALLWILQKRVHPIFGASGGAFTLKPFISYCLPLLFSAIVLQVMNSIDTLMTGYFLDIGQVGVFGAATLLASLVSISIEVLNPLFLSITTSAFAEDRHHVVTGTFNSNNRWYLYLCLPVASLLALLAPQAMTQVWGAEFGAGARVLLLLVIGRAIFYLSATSSHLLEVYARTKLILVLNVSAAVVNCALNWWLIPRFGIEGAALATSTTLTLRTILLITAARSVYSPGGLRVISLRVLAAAVIPCLGVLWIRNMGLSDLTTLLAGGVLYCILFLGMLKLFGAFEEEDRHILRQIRRRIGFGSKSQDAG